MLPQLLTTFAASCQTSTFFFGLVPWYRYLPPSDFDSSGCNIKNFQLLSGSVPGGNNQASDIPLVLLAVVDDLLRLAGLVAVGFIIYAAIQYVTSQGNPEQTAKAQNTIINALTGLAIALVAVIFVSYLGNHLR